MAAPSFAHVTEEGFQSFSHELSKGEWALIDIKPFEGPNRTAAKSLLDAPLQVVWKLRLNWIIGGLADARGGADVAAEADTVWDSGQRRLSALLSAAALDPDAQKRAAAERLKKAFLKGAGEGQTRLRYQQEVDFGRMQEESAKETQNAADIALLGLGGVFAEIAQSTDALASAIGHGQGKGYRPSERVRVAVNACSLTFSSVEEVISLVAEKGIPTDRTRAQALLATLHALAKRYPAPSAGASAEAPAPTTEAPKTP